MPGSLTNDPTFFVRKSGIFDQVVRAMTGNKPTVPTQAMRKMLRQVSGRYASKFTLGGREKRQTRRLPSLPKLKCLEHSEVNLEEDRPSLLTRCS